MTRGQLFVLSGPSGVGKSTIVKEVMRRHPMLRFSVSATTREIRPGEIDGVSYYFVTKQAFESMIERDELLEHAQYVGNYYGTPEQPVNDFLNQGYDVLLDIEVQGALQIMEKRKDAVTIFIAAPSFEELERRLISRGDTAPDKIRRRLETARREYQVAQQYDYLVLSQTNQVEQAADEVLAIMKAAGCRTQFRVDYLKEAN